LKGLGGNVFTKSNTMGASQIDNEEPNPEKKDGSEDEFEGDENLPNFWFALNGRDQKYWYAQEVYM